MYPFMYTSCPTPTSRNYIASVFQGRGVAAAITMLSASSLKQDARRQSLQKLSNFTAVAASAGVKKSSVCLQTKFQLVRCSASVV